MLISLLALIGSCVAYGVASVMQAVGARRKSGLHAIFTAWYLLGLVLNAVAFALSYIAIERLPLFLVNAVLAGSVAITVVVARFALGTVMRGWDATSVGGVVVGTVLLALAAGDEPPLVGWDELEVAAGTFGVALVLVTIWLWLRHGSAWALAICSGLGFGLMTFGVRTIHGYSAADLEFGWFAILGVLAGVAVAGGASLLGFQRGNVGMVVAVQNGVSVVMGSVLGIVVLHDTIATGFLWALLLGLLVIVASCTRLSFSPAMRAVS